MAKILIIDDDFGWRSLYRLELGGAHQMLEAADPLEALEIIPRKRPDLAISARRSSQSTPTCAGCDVQ